MKKYLTLPHSETVLLLMCIQYPDSLSSYEPRHDRTNKMTVRPAKTQISLGIRPIWSVFAVRMKKAWVLSYPLSALQRLWSDWANAQADLSRRWAHTHFVGFVTSRLIYSSISPILCKASPRNKGLKIFFRMKGSSGLSETKSRCYCGLYRE